MDSRTPGSPVLYYLPEFAQTYVCWVGDAIPLSHPLPPPSPFAFNLSSIRDFPRISSSPEVVQVLGFQLLSFLKEVTFALLAANRTGGIGQVEFDEAGNGELSRADCSSPGYIQEQGCNFKLPVRNGRGEATRWEERTAQVLLTGLLLKAVEERTAVASICSACRSTHCPGPNPPNLIQAPPASGWGAGPSDRQRNQSTSCHTRAETQGTAQGPASPCSSLSDLHGPRSSKSSSSIQPADSHGIRPHELEHHHIRLMASQRARHWKASLSGVESVLTMGHRALIHAESGPKAEQTCVQGSRGKMPSPSGWGHGHHRVRAGEAMV